MRILGLEQAEEVFLVQGAKVVVEHGNRRHGSMGRAAAVDGTDQSPTRMRRGGWRDAAMGNDGVELSRSVSRKADPSWSEWPLEGKGGVSSLVTGGRETAVADA